LAGLQQDAEAFVVDASIVADDGEAFDARVPDRFDQRLRDAAEAEAA
jgi:hypothetical protein